MEDTPRELAVGAFQSTIFWGRLGQALGAQRQFPGGRHELRNATDGAATAAPGSCWSALQNELNDARRWRTCRRVIERLQRLVEQLLQVARAGPTPSCSASRTLTCRRWCVTWWRHKCAPSTSALDLVPRPMCRGAGQGSAAQLSALIGNLVDNALLHRQAESSTVSTAMQGDRRPCCVSRRHGPRYPCRRSARVSSTASTAANSRTRQAQDGGGSKSGLAIVKAIADRHRAEVKLSDAHEAASGLMVRSHLPGIGLSRRSQSASAEDVAHGPKHHAQFSDQLPELAACQRLILSFACRGRASHPARWRPGWHIGRSPSHAALSHPRSSRNSASSPESRTPAAPVLGQTVPARRLHARSRPQARRSSSPEPSRIPAVALPAGVCGCGGSRRVAPYRASSSSSSSSRMTGTGVRADARPRSVHADTLLERVELCAHFPHGRRTRSQRR